MAVYRYIEKPIGRDEQGRVVMARIPVRVTAAPPAGDGTKRGRGS